MGCYGNHELHALLQTFCCSFCCCLKTVIGIVILAILLHICGHFTLEPKNMYLIFRVFEVTSSAIVGLNACLSSPHLPDEGSCGLLWICFGTMVKLIDVWRNCYHKILYILQLRAVINIPLKYSEIN